MDQEVCYKIVSPGNGREATLIDTSTTWLPKQDSRNYENTSRHANMAGEISWGPASMQRPTGN